MIGVAVLIVVECFAFVGGWLSPGRLTQERMIDGFEEVNGVSPRISPQPRQGRLHRRSLRQQREGVRLSKAAVFRPGQTPVIRRLSLAGGQPYMPDRPAALSAARYPIVLYGSLELPPILPHDAALYAVLRRVHAVLAILLFATFIAHFAAALMHALIYRDGVFPSMAPWRIRVGKLGPAAPDQTPIA
jgi:hypothetical protein